MIVFFIGYSNDRLLDTPIRIKDTLKYIGHLNSYATECKLVSTEIDNVIFFCYKTPRNYPAQTWDNLRVHLFNALHTIPEYNEFENYISVDNDDFLYTPNIDECLKLTDTVFHAREFLSHDKLNLDDDFKFISCSYYYRILGAKNTVNLQDHKHTYCRYVNFKDKFKNCCHSHPGLRVHCNDNNEKICYAFGCLDLDYLKTEKHWIQSTNNNESTYNLSEDEIETEFKKYYKLDEDTYTDLITTANYMKSFFSTV